MYSNTINAIINLNRQMVMSSGRVGILTTNFKVYDILERAGLHNMMRVYRSEDEVESDSEEIIRHSTSVIDVSALKGKSILKDHQEDTPSSKFAQYDQADMTLDESVSSTSRASDQYQNENDNVSRTRLGPQDRLRNVNARQDNSRRVRARAWDKAQTANSGLVLTDDTVSGAIVPNKELNHEALQTLTSGSSSKGVSIFIGLFLIAAIVGLFFGWKNWDILKARFLKSETIIEKPYESPAQVIDTATPELVEDTISSEPKVEEPVVVKPKPKPKPKPKIVSRSKRSVSKPRPKRRAPKPVPKPRPEAVGTNHVRITSNPSGATVLVNYADKGKTPLTVKLSHKTNIVILQKPGYDQYKTRINLADQQKELDVDLVREGAAPPPVSKPVQRAKPKVVVKPTPPPPAPTPPAPKPIKRPEPPKQKNIMVTSVPRGANVFVNGSRMGVTPVSVTLYSESNNISIKKTGYVDFVTTVPRNSSKAYVSATLNKEQAAYQPPPPPPQKPVSKPAVQNSPLAGSGPTGKIFVASRPPAAKIFVDGVDKGFLTNHWLNLPAGSHTIVLKKGAMSAEKTIEVKPGPNKSAYIILK